MALLDRLMPRFLGIGAMRAGTSWLARHLAEHPSIRMKRKELHFFDRKIERRVIPLLPADTDARLRYGCRFIPAALTGEVFGEFTPSYAILDPDRIARIHRWMPDARILFIMRDPVERAWSHAKHDYPRWLGRRAEEASRSELMAWFDLPWVRQRGDYFDCLTNWMRYFERSQLFLTFLEDVIADPRRVLEDAFVFLGVAPEDADLSRIRNPVHASPGPPIPDWVRDYLEPSFRAPDARLRELLGRNLPWNGPKH
jgi:hypothetical protein